jgi:hypothetical protein
MTITGLAHHQKIGFLPDFLDELHAVLFTGIRNQNTSLVHVSPPQICQDQCIII